MDLEQLCFSSQHDDINEIKDYYKKIVSILSTYNIGFWEYDIEAGKLNYLNDFMYALNLESIGITRDMLEKPELFIHPDDYPSFYAAFHSSSYPIEKNMKLRYRCLGPTGDCIWLEDHFFPAQRCLEEAGRKILGYTINAEALLEKEEQLRKQQLRYETIIEAFPGFIFVFDDQFYIRDIYMAKGQSLLHSMDELIGIDGREVFSPEVSRMYHQNICDCLKEGMLKEIEYHLDMNNVRYYFQARIVPFEDDKVLVMIQDIGDRIRRIEELVEAKKREEANLMKSAFLANMSHEIRTPLNAIVGFSEILMEGENPEQKDVFIDIIRKNSDLLLQLIDDILDISQIESGRIDINFHRTEINSLINEVENMHRIRMSKRVEFVVDRPVGEIWAFTDPNRVKQVLHNFISNAIKHTKEGRITLRLEKDGEDSLLFSVSDTGTGIAPGNIDAIFDRFEKLDSFAQGTGLGLPISKSIVELLGGQINVSSTLGVGSTFSFNLPCHTHADEELIRSRKGKAFIKSEKELGRRKKILVAEYVEKDFEYINAVLGSDYELIRATSEPQLLSLYTTEKPDLVWINIPVLIVKDSIEAIEQIRASSATIPLIAVTKQGYYSEQRLALEAGCDDVVMKPYAASRIQDAIVAYI